MLGLCISFIAACGSPSIPSDIPQLVVSRNQQDVPHKQAFDLGLTEVGTETVFYNFSVASVAKDPISITKIEYTNPEDFTILSNSMPGVVTREKDAGFEVSFHPGVRGFHESEISVYVEGFSKPFVLHLTGEAR